MGTKIAMGFDLESPQYLDSRQSFDTLENMNNCDTTLFPDGFITYCSEDKKHYTLNKDLNSWDEFTGTGGGGGNNTAPMVNIEDNIQTIYAVDDEISIPYYVTDAEGGKMFVKYYIDDQEVESGQIKLGKNVWKIGTLSKKATPYNLMIVVSDQQGLEGFGYLNITVGQLELTSTFNQDIDYRLDTPILINYSVDISDFTGLKVYRTIDDKQDMVEITKKNNEWNLGLLDKGIHTIKLRAVKGNVFSNELQYTFVVLDSAGLYMSSNFAMTTATIDDKIEIDFKISCEHESKFKTYVQINDNPQTVLSTSIGVSNYWTIGYLKEGQYTLKLITKTLDEQLSSNQLIFNLTVTKANYEPQEPVIDSSLVCWFDAKGKSNNSEEDRHLWIDKSSNKTKATLHNLNFKTNGWIDDDLVLNGEAYCEIDYKPFDRPLLSGLTIDLLFKMRNVGDINGRVISCEQFDSPYNGIYIDTVNSYIKVGGSEIISAIGEEEYTRISFVIDKNSKYMFIYVNAVICSVAPISDNDLNGFRHDGKIYLNCRAINNYLNPVGNFGDCNIRSFRIYNRTLNYEEILQNYISDMKIDEQQVVKQKNYPKANEGLPTMTFVGDMQPLLNAASKDVKVELDIDFKSNGRNDVASFSEEKVVTRCQGTSTLSYPVKNFKIKLLGTDDNGRIIKENWAQQKTYTLKADFMESTHANNLGSAIFIPTVYDEPIVIDGQEVRTTIDGFPMLVYNKPTKTSEPVFIGIYCFNLDKGFKDSYLDKNNPKHMFYIGGINDSTGQGATGFWDWSNDAIDEGWELEFAGGTDGEATKDKIKNKQHDELSRLIQWVAETDEQKKWKSEMPAYLNVKYTIDYLLCALVLGMVDSLGKNMRLVTYDGLVWYPTFYDMDTILGVDNSGALKFNPDVEFSEYNTSNSALWTKMFKFMKSEIKDRYMQLRVSNKFSIDNIMNTFGGQIIDLIGERFYNKEVFDKYMPQGTEYLMTMAHGNRIGGLKRWLKERLIFVDSFFEVGGEYEKQLIMRLNPVGDRKARLALRTYSPQYIRVQFGAKSDNFWYGKVNKDSLTEVELPIHSNDLECMIYSANELMNVEGLNKLTMTHLKLNNAVKLTELNAANNKLLQTLAFDVPENSKTKRYLQKLNIKNCTGFVGSSILDLRECISLKELDASDSSISTIQFSDGGSLKKINLSNTNIVNFSIKGHEYLEYINLDGCKSLDTFTLESCNQISSIELTNSTLTRFTLEDCKGIERIDISGSYRISTLALPYLPNLKEINISNTSSNIRELDLRNSPNIEKIVARNCSGLTTIKLASNCTSLKHLDVQQTSITDLTFGNGSIGNGVDLRTFNMEYINFSNCPNVITIKLNKVIFKDDSSYIFNNCKKLTRIDGTVVLSGSCTDTFYNCIELANFPTIEFDKSVTSLYRTFSHCERITMDRVKNILSACTNLTNANETFSQCINVTGAIPVDLFRNNTKLKILNYTFAQCNISGELPEGLFDGLDDLNTIDYIFYQNDKITGSIPANLFANNEKLTSTKAAFYFCGLNGQLPGNLFINNPELLETNYMFANNKLTGEIPNNLLAGCRKLVNTEYMFASNELLTGNIPGELFKDCVALKNISHMFLSCDLLGKELSIPGNLFVNNRNLSHVSGFFKGKKFTGSIPGELFAQNTNIVNVTELFSDCSELTGTIPEGLFTNCTRITTATRIFNGCSKIESIPNELFNSFKSKLQYVQEAFANCNGLSGELPENIINNSPQLSDASGLFYNCSETASSVPARLFEGCTNLRNISNVFGNCKKLRGAIPENLFESLVNVETFSSIFYNCYELGANKPIPAKLFEKNINAIYFDNTFSNCTNIGGDKLVSTNDIPETLFKYCKKIRSVNSLFYGCTNLAGKIPDGLFENCDQLISITSVFNNCINLVGSIPDDLFKGCTSIVTMDYAFANCSKLTDLPQVLFESCKNTLNKNVTGLFKDCSSLTGTAIKFWNGYNVTTSLECYKNCFALTDYAMIEPTYK